MNAETEMKLEALSDLVESLETRLDDALNRNDDLLQRLELARLTILALRDTACKDMPTAVAAINRTLEQL